MNTQDSITAEDLEAAIDDLSMMPYFPSESRASVIRLLTRMCPHRTALRWLVDECVNHVGKWPGPAELRGLLCTRYDAADDIDAYCNLPGYTPAEMEARHIEQHEALKAGGWDKQAEEQFKQISGGVKLRQIAAGRHA